MRTIRVSPPSPEQTATFAARLAANAETLTNMVEALLSLSTTRQAAIRAAPLDLPVLARCARRWPA